MWFGAVYLEGGYEYLDNLLFHQTIDRAVNSFHHEEPFYYYFIAIWYSLAPWSFLLVGVGVAVVSKWRQFIRTDLQKLFFSVFLATFVVLSCISSKLQVYLIRLTLPDIPGSHLPAPHPVEPLAGGKHSGACGRIGTGRVRPAFPAPAR